MTEQQIVQTRMSADSVTRLDSDREALGLPTRSDAIREGLRLLHREARLAALSNSYDDFYGAGHEAPLGDIAAVGDQIAADTMASADTIAAASSAAADRE